MNKQKIIGITLFFILGLFSLSFCEEQITITTYYPSPYGSYVELTAHRMKIGRTFSDSGVTVNDDNLAVEGSLSIGGWNPGNFRLWIPDNSRARINWVTIGGYAGGGGPWDSVSGLYSLWLNAEKAGGSGGDINLQTEGNTKMIIRNDGNVGIGTTGPVHKLEVIGTPWPWGSGILLSPNDVAIWGRNSGGTPRRILFLGGDVTYVLGQDNGIRFRTGNDDPVNDRLTIDSSGNVGIGTTSPGNHFQVNDIGPAGPQRFGVGSGTNNLYAFGTTQTSWSDKRLKENIQSQHGMLNRIMAVKPVTYYWKPEARLDNKMHYGVIAQELREIFPTLVYEDQDGYLNVQRDEMQFILIQSIKELKMEKDLLRQEVEILKSELKNLRAKLK